MTRNLWRNSQNFNTRPYILAHLSKEELFVLFSSFSIAPKCASPSLYSSFHNVLTHIERAGEKNYKTFDYIKHILINRQKVKPYENYLQEQNPDNYTADFTRAANKLADAGTLTRNGAEQILAAFRRFDTILGCLDVDTVVEAEKIPVEVTALAEERAAARKAKNFAESDRLRDEIAKLGYIIKDAPGGIYELKKA